MVVNASIQLIFKDVGVEIWGLMVVLSSIQLILVGCWY